MYNKQIKNLISNIHKPPEPTTLDIVLEGGAFNGMYEIGAMLFVKELEKQNYIKVNRISGASIGSLIAFSYFTDNLENVVTSYKHLKEHWRENLNLEYYETQLNKIINEMDEKNITHLLNDKLYINYHNVYTLEETVQTTYKDKWDIRDAILKSSHIPTITNQNICQEQFFIDGGQPFIFPEIERKQNYKQLYISINNIRDLSSMMRVKDNNPDAKILAGILECYQLFNTETKTTLCSFIDQWNTMDYIMLRGKRFFLHFIVISLFLFINIQEIIERNEKIKCLCEYTGTKLFIKIFLFLFKNIKLLFYDLTLYYCFT
jgi:predicted patatin/cPLA2 family phospholipase